MGPLMLDVSGYELDAEEREILQHPTVGGVIFFGRNYHDKAQLSALVKDIRKTVAKPLLLAVDQEGGRVQRFRDEFTLLPPVKAFAQQADGERLAKLGGRVMAAELLALDIDLSLSPVLDLGFDCRAIGDRAFSDQPSEIIRYAGEFIRGMRSVGMAATGKHFPGHGGVLADSHLETPFDARENIKAHDMMVFKGLIEQNLLDAMMPAHVIYPAFDDRPASGSPYWLKTVLRKELNFSGVIFSDDLDMKGADIMGSYAERALQAQQAGCDMVMLCNNRKGAIEALDALPQTQVPLLNSLLKKSTSENVTETQQWKREQQEIAQLRDDWLTSQA